MLGAGVGAFGDALDLHAVEAQPVEHGAARGRDGGDERDHRDRDRDPRPPPAPRARLESRAHARGDVGRLGPLDGQLGEAGFELAHSSPSRFASARDSRDFTVPGRHPSTAAVSCSESPSR